MLLLLLPAPHNSTNPPNNTLLSPPCSVVLTELLEGGIMRADPQARREWEELQQTFRPPADFRMKVGAGTARTACSVPAVPP
jgi:hypothetical protein